MLVLSTAAKSVGLLVVFEHNLWKFEQLTLRIIMGPVRFQGRDFAFLVP